ncbi:sorbin and SH3 domain-containing protein 1-like isoform X6 [Amphibalanus amphitrite]|uniref:sorbin and SH3 domain-containing protein 1-like isoform X6 n=1 Tax=Amphibalanus amphitrite TaxID=1232801 RepID=UPI001C91AEE1|nr:sorbin and SH3 domain-containing protein 1-like isoform X6 [Amphibalanus amphitrite]
MLRTLQNSFRRSKEKSVERKPEENGVVTNGDASQSAGDSQGVTSPLPPPSPKSLSRSPSLRRKELQQSMHESVTSFIEAETSQLLKEIDSALGNKYDLGVWQPGSTPPSTPSQPEVKPKREDGPLIKEPVWTPKSSPTLERKQYRPINYDSNSLERKKKAELPSPPPPPPSEWDAPERVTVPVRSSSLPRPESATVTLLREARQGHLPRGAQYLSTVDGGRVVPPRRAPPVKEVEGVGPTTTGGMPVALRSTVKGENRQDWYRRVYDNLHRQPQARSSYGLGGYSSEPDAGYEDELNPRVPPRQAAERYRGQPGRIEDYTPGQSSLAEQEAAKYWEEVMGYFDKAANQAAPPGNHSNYVPRDEHDDFSASRENGIAAKSHKSEVYRYMNRGLDGYESDSTLVYHRNEPPALTSGEQRSYYNQIQRGGEVPLSGLRKPAPERPKAAGPRYQEAAVNIHYRSPVRWEEKEPLSEDELRRRQEDTMRRAYEEARRRKEERQAEDRESRRHGDNFTPSQKSPIPLDRYERLFDDVTDDRRPTLTASVLHEFRAQNNRELSLSRGETVRIRRKIDSNWYEGQKGTRIGIFPVTYVQVIDPRERSADRWSSRPQVRAKHRFSAQSAMELSLNKGDVVTILRRVDDNWYEGRRGDATGIFPASYVEPLTADHGDGGPRQKPVGAPAAHGLVMDGLSLRAPGERDQLRVDVKQNTMLYRVMFPYRHQNEDELDLEEGDMIQVLEQCPDGWYVGTNMRTGMFGTFPGNYTRRM